MDKVVPHKNGLRKAPDFAQARRDRCWICQEKFISHGGTNPQLIFHEHHVVPRAYGGENGPTVTVCTGHHNLLHLVADKLIPGKPDSTAEAQALLRSEHPSRLPRLMYLVDVVVKAHKAVENDPNKRGQVAFICDGETKRRLEQLAKAEGCSQNNLVILLINQAFVRKFPLPPRG